jgi:DNA processing protein
MDIHTALREVDPPVTSLYQKGDGSILGAPAIAIVGTRRPSIGGLKAALLFSRVLARKGFVIVSGLARGIDATAHGGALEVGGRTIAVLGHGLDRVYPPENRGLASEILEKRGLLVSEYAAGTTVEKYHFPARNRIIAALSFSIIIIEAGEKSGALSTARAGLNLGRDIYVVPGRFDEESFLGGHRLIQQGASLALGPDDILGTEGCGASEMQPALFPSLPEPLSQLQILFKKLGKRATLEDLFVGSNLMFPELMDRLKTAEEQGLVKETSAQNYLWLE